MHSPGKFARSIEIMKMSAHVVMKHKKLMVFPMLSGVFIVLIVAIFFSSSAVITAGDHVVHWNYDGSGLKYLGDSRFAAVALFALYVSFLFASTFVNVALYHEIMEALAWEQVSIRRGLAFARQRILSIAAWSLFAGTIGFILRQFAERLGVVGSFVLRLIGVTWSVASVFAIPVIIRETSANPLTLLRQSARTIRKTWGESLIGVIGTDLLVFVAMIFGALAIIITLSVVTWLGVDSGVTFIAGIVIVGTFVVLGQLFLSMFNSVFRCALYIYASEGVVPAPYSAELMESAWQVKK